MRKEQKRVPMSQDERNIMKNKNIFIFFLIIVICVVSFFLIYEKLDFCAKKHNFVNSGIVCNGDRIIDKKSYIKTVDYLNQYINEKIELKKADSVSIFFRDLNNGPTFGINENEFFASASLLKIPIIFSILKLAEEDPGILNINLVYEGSIRNEINQSFLPEEKVVANVSYSVDELIRRTLVYSDNTAIEMLYEFSEMQKKGNVVATLRELGLVLPNDLSDHDISTRLYSSLFRLLYNSSYLNPEYSEMVLALLAQSKFESGLKDGVPEGVVVANKFGERFVGDLKQLHDCGIVYYPKNPYLLCIMTSGNNFSDLEEIIKEISGRVYKEVNSRRKQ